ncbi:MAG: hypothetical protein J5654_12390 [Victivallales bacterium]|nr:hypothetical protein [Victivallales bacterium]
MKPKTRQTLLIIALIVVTLLVFCTYFPIIQLPTQSRVEEKLRELKSLRGDLGVARKTYEDRVAMIEGMQQLTGPFWITTGPISRLDQEITSEFNRLTRMAQVSSVSGTQKVDVARDKPGSALQEVTLAVDFKNISMRELTQFFTQLRKDRNASKFRWEYAKLTPDNPRTPKSVNFSLRFHIYALNADTLSFLGLNEDKTEASPPPTPERRANKPHK